MSFEPLLDASLAIKAHVATVAAAFLIGLWLIVMSKKGAPGHRALGYAFLALMASTSIISLFIHEYRPDSPIFGLSPTHLVSAFVLFAVWRALDGARKGDVAQHRFWATGVFVGALVINGAVNVLVIDGTMHNVIFGGER